MSEPTDLEIALFVQREKDRLPLRTHDFIDHTVGILLTPRLSAAQYQWLHGLFDELGGKIT
jgi:hypothetical protein